MGIKKKFFKSKPITIYVKNTHINKYKMLKVYVGGGGRVKKNEKILLSSFL